MPQQDRQIDLGVNRPADARAANDRIAQTAEHHRVVARLPMLCECSDPGCHCLFLISPSAYYQARAEADNYLTLPGHGLDGARSVTRTLDYWIQRLHT